ncbi:MAG: ATP-binding protein [Flavobacteriaceae bacterium]|nr:ATP-binding protein [Flavobacteriaceae bacterium]
MGSVGQTIVSDRGEADYFHGRQEEIDFVKGILEKSQEKKKAHSVLIQGAPGVGKTALLRKLEEVGKKLGWHIAKMEFEAFWDVNVLHHVLFKQKKFEKRAKEIRGDIGLLKGSMRYEKTKPIFSKMIQSIQKPMILVLDEAQMISYGHTKDSPEMKQASYVLNQFHNLQNKKGLIFLVAGLSDTRKIFKDFKISRFNSRCVINLNLLDRESEKRIIQDYLVKGGGVDSRNPDLLHWIDRISQETYQWAHHISCYGQVALEMVKNKKGILSNQILTEVLEESRELKIEYYDGRFEELQAFERASIFYALFENEVNEKVIIGNQVESDFEINPIVKNAESMFQDVVSRGIIQIRRDGFYEIPIPSLRTWMLGEYQEYLKMMNQKPSPKIQKLFQALKQSS